MRGGGGDERNSEICRILWNVRNLQFLVSSEITMLKVKELELYNSERGISTFFVKVRIQGVGLSKQGLSIKIKR